MRAVLGIDAAWTLAQPSGVALAAETIDGWRLIAVASSYQHFDALADDRLTREARPRGSMPDARALLASATRLCGTPVDLALLWQILSSTGFPNHFFCDSWVVGFWRGRPWLAGHRIGKTSLAIGSSRFWIGWATRRGDKCVRSTCRD